MRFALIVLFTLFFTARLFAEDTLRVAILHDSVGTSIDSAEKVRYHLFPFWSTAEFSNAIIVMKADSTFTLCGTMKDGSIRRLPCTREEFRQHRYLVCYYAGLVPPPDSLWPALIEIMIRSTTEIYLEQF